MHGYSAKSHYIGFSNKKQFFLKERIACFCQDVVYYTNRKVSGDMPDKKLLHCPLKGIIAMKITEETMRQQRLAEAQAADSDASCTDPAAAPLLSCEADASRQEKQTLSEREKLKNMSRGDQAWYIWAYYKFHILGAVILLFLFYIVGSSVYRSTFKTALHCIYVNSRSESGVNFAPLEEDFAAWLALGKKDMISTEAVFISFGNDATNFSYANMAKISALVSANDLDILICDQESLNHYAEMDGFLDLEQQLSPEVLNLVRDRLYFCPGSDGISRACAIDLTGTDFATSSQLTQAPPLLGIITTTQRMENAEALIRYIFAP